MLDKFSTWGYDNGLKSMVTTLLQFGLVGSISKKKLCNRDSVRLLICPPRHARRKRIQRVSALQRAVHQVAPGERLHARHADLLRALDV